MMAQPFTGGSSIMEPAARRSSELSQVVKVCTLETLATRFSQNGLGFQSFKLNGPRLPPFSQRAPPLMLGRCNSAESLAVWHRYKKSHVNGPESM